jgi:hypothetical protein
MWGHYFGEEVRGLTVFQDGGLAKRCAGIGPRLMFSDVGIE